MQHSPVDPEEMWTFNAFSNREQRDRRRLQPSQLRPAIPDVVRFAEEWLGFTPDGPQKKLLLSKAKRLILLCTRQWGKSTVAALMAVHRAYFYPGSLVIVASPTERQSAEFLLKARGFMQRLKIPVRGDGHHRSSLRFPNGSRIIGLPGTEVTIRGYSKVSLMIIDEAARVADEMYKALRPSLAVEGGDLWLISTPNGKRGFFYENWVEGGDEWERTTVTATECPRIPESFLQEERRQLGDKWFRQEYLCEFGDDDAGMFPRELVRGALDDLEPMVFARSSQPRP